MKRTFELNLQVTVEIPDHSQSAMKNPVEIWHEEFLEAFFNAKKALRDYCLYQTADLFFNENVSLNNISDFLPPDRDMDRLMLEVSSRCSKETAAFFKILFGNQEAEGNEFIDVDQNRNYLANRLSNLSITAGTFKEK